MLDDIRIEIDGNDPDNPDSNDGDGPTASRGPGVSIAIWFVALLALGVVAMFAIPALRGSDDASQPTLDPTMTSPAISAADPGVATPTTTSSVVDASATTSTPVSVPVSVEPATQTTTSVQIVEPALPDTPIESAQAAMDAWGRFTATGNLADLDIVFDPTGPQYRQLAAEAPALEATAASAVPYTVTLDTPTVVSQTPTETVIAATALWERPGEPTQAYRWHLVLHPRLDGAWTLWTIRND